MRASSPSTQLPGPWLVINDSQVHRSRRRASQGPHSHLEGPGPDELVQLQGQPLNLYLNHEILPNPSCGGIGLSVCSCSPGKACGIGSQTVCSSDVSATPLAVYSQASPSPCCRAICSLVTSSFQGLSPQREINVCLGDCRCPMKSVLKRKQQVLARVDRLQKY